MSGRRSSDAERDAMASSHRREDCAESPGWFTQEPSTLKPCPMAKGTTDKECAGCEDGKEASVGEMEGPHNVLLDRLTAKPMD